MRNVLRALAVAASVFAVPHAHAAKLNTADLLGTWVGSYTDTVFGTGGPAVIIVAPLGGGGALFFTWHFGGNFFGCGEVGPVSGGAFPGGGDAKVTAHALSAHGEDGVFGKNVRAHTRGTKFFASGKDACQGAGPKKWRAVGKLAGTDFTASVATKVSGGTGHMMLTLHKVL